MPRPRRRTDPRELAAVLERLERLRTGSAPSSAVATAPVHSGWVPTEPDQQPDHQPDHELDHQPDHQPVDHARRAIRAGFGVRLLDLWRTRAFDPGRSGVAVLAVVALLAGLGGVWYFVTARPAAGSAGDPIAAVSSISQPGGLPDGSEPPAAQLDGWPTPGPAEPSGQEGAAASSAAVIIVDVVGKVAAPGVVELPAGARIRDAIEAAGGALPGIDLTALDLASRLSDGQEIFVGIPVPSGTGTQAAGGVVGGEGASGSGGSDASAADAGGGSSSGVVDLNAASLTDLETLPGVGPVLGQHILDWRKQHGHFTSVTQLQQVSGIGPAKYAALVSRVHV